MLDKEHDLVEHEKVRPFEFFFVTSSLHSLALISGSFVVGFLSFFAVMLMCIVPYLESNSISVFKNHFGDKIASFVERFELYPYESCVVALWFLGSAMLFVNVSLACFFAVVIMIVSSLLMQYAQNIDSLSFVEKKAYRESSLRERLRLAWSESYRRKKKFEAWQKRKKTNTILEDALERASVKKVFADEKSQDWEDARNELKELSEFKLQKIDERVEKWLDQESQRLVYQESERPFQLSSERAR